MPNMVKPFRFWVQNVLPTVYDDSLSYYELLNKVVEYLNRTISEVNGVSAELQMFENWVVNYFDSVDFQSMVNEKLDEMAEDGTLDQLINKPKMLVPSDEDKESYKNETLECIASYLVNEIGSNSIVNPAGVVNKDTEFYAVYDDTGKSYTSLFEKDVQNSFDYDDTYDSKPIMYMNCSAMLMLITKCRKYSASPYYYAFNNLADYNESTALSKCWEAGTYNDKPWTFDCMNEVTTWHIAYVMDKSGCTLVKLKDKSKEAYEDVLNTLETGDILFFGNESTYSSRYKGIHHCAYYIKKLSDIDKAGEYYNATFKSVPRDSHNSGEYGYVFHSSSGVADERTDVLRIDTLDYIFFTAHNIDNIYVCKPYSNAMNSNKAQRSTVGWFTAGDEYFLAGKDMSADSVPMDGFGYNENTKKTNLYNLGVRGPIVEVADLNNLTDGLYTITSFQSTANRPSDSGSSSAVVVQYATPNDKRGVQICIDGNGNMYYRIRPNQVSWLRWRKVTATIPE